MRRTIILTTLVSVISSALLLSSVYADPIPVPNPNPFERIDYVIEVLFSEAVAWIIGGELLYRLSKRKQQGVSRFQSYAIMFLVIAVSFFVGLFFWKIFGWI